MVGPLVGSRVPGPTADSDSSFGAEGAVEGLASRASYLTFDHRQKNGRSAANRSMTLVPHPPFPDSGSAPAPDPGVFGIRIGVVVHVQETLVILVAIDPER